MHTAGLQDHDAQVILARLDSACTFVKAFLNRPQFDFRGMTPSLLENTPGVYAIFDREKGIALYVGRTKNIRRRLYTNHLMGQATNARLKKYLVEDSERPDIPDIQAAKEYLLNNCYFQYICITDMKTRARAEGLLSYALNVIYIHEEH